MSNAKSFLDRGLADTTPYPLNIEVDSACGVWINTTNNGKLFDAISGIGVSNWGHQNSVITNLLHHQIDSSLHTMVYGEMLNRNTVKAAALLSDLLPKNLNTTYFTNSGAEAIEGALKLAKRATGRSKLIACSGGYHGNTAGALAVSSNNERKAPFEPLLPGVKFIDFNCSNSLNSIDAETACVLVETVQGDAGVRIPNPYWIQELRAKCNQEGALLILDEVQCGMGRTGKPFAFEHFNVVPDILCLGKALGGGMPIGAFVSSRDLMSQLSHSPKLGHITTFGGHPVATAGALGALELLKETNWSEVEAQGEYWESQLNAHPKVKSVRRIGLFMCVKMDGADQVSKAVENGLKEGVLLFWFLSVPNAFRLSPPLNMTDAESKLGIELILKSLSF
ncbi:MAG: aspartate aminotransferase family protein [Crocinitomicaceae bacterium]|nr:aspartate aminotransferase family protein [Crocinitomicaceae bacterium]|tara:strand:- start:5943 stop:7124 length:1182 start_codon:yes stop_codon:yes gene_type:complete